MKKSQIAAAIALSYVAGGIVAPISNIYAEAVLTPNCAQSVDVATAGIITGTDITRIVAEIKELPVYAAYQNIINIKTKYSAKDENGVTLAARIDQTVTDTSAAKTAADTALATAQGNYDGYNPADLGNKVKQLARSYSFDGKDIETIVAEVATTVASYDDYVAIREKVTAGDLSGAKQAILAFNEAQNGAFANDTALGQMMNATDARTLKSLLNAGGQGMATHYGRLYLEVQKANALIDALDEAQTAADAATTAATAAAQAQTDANQEIIDAANAIAALGKDAVIRARSTVVNTLKFVKEKDTYGGVADFDLMSDFVNYVEAGVADDDSQTAHTSLNGYLSLTAIATEDEKNNILDPIADNRKVCDARGIVAVKGSLPIYHFAVEVEEVTNGHFGFAEKVVYEITLNYKGAPYTIGNEVEVVINVPYNISVDTAEVFYVNGGQLESMEIVERDADEATITFKTNHFSQYALVGERKADADFGGNDADGDTQFGVDGPDEEFGGNASEGDTGFTNPEGPDEEFGGFGGDQGFDAPIISVGTEPLVKPTAPTVETPNTGVAASTTTGNATATSGIVASLIAMASAAVALVVRFARQSGRKA